jgi:hypothetical protein
MLDHGSSDAAPVIVALPPEIHASNTQSVFDPLYAALTSGAPVVIADLSATVACDLVTLYGLLRVRDWASARQVRFRLVIPSGASLRRVFELLAIDRLLPVYPSVGEALRVTTDPARQPPPPPYPPWPVPLGSVSRRAVR